MHRIDGPGATGEGRFTEGDPAVPVHATDVTDSWLNMVQDELENVLDAAKIVPAKGNNAQVVKAIKSMIIAGRQPLAATLPLQLAVDEETGQITFAIKPGFEGQALTVKGGILQWADVADRYDIGQYYMFQDELERPGHFPCMGGLVTGVTKKYPQIVEYLQSAHGQFRCVTQAKYDELHVYSWHTNADGTKVGWDGIGGVNRFVLDLGADTLRLPDLRGMSPEMVSATLGVGDVQGDGTRPVEGYFQYSALANGNGLALYAAKAEGPFVPREGNLSVQTYSTSASGAVNRQYVFNYENKRVEPVFDKVQTRAFVSMYTVYFGQPS